MRAMGRLAFGPGRADGADLYPGGMLHLSGLYLLVYWVYKQGNYAACI
jgi:hypothetical protein